MRPGALPLPQQILLNLTIPPVLAVFWRFMAAGWEAEVQGEEIGKRIKRRHWFEFWVVLLSGYLALLGFTIYALLT